MFKKPPRGFKKVKNNIDSGINHYDNSGEIKFDRRLEFDEKELPEIKEWKVGENYKLTVTVKQTDQRQSNDGTFSGSFLVTGVKSEK